MNEEDQGNPDALESQAGEPDQVDVPAEDEMPNVTLSDKTPEKGEVPEAAVAVAGSDHTELVKKARKSAKAALHCLREARKNQHPDAQADPHETDFLYNSAEKDLVTVVETLTL